MSSNRGSTGSEGKADGKRSSQTDEDTRREKKSKTPVFKRLSRLFKRHSKITDSSFNINDQCDSNDDSDVSYFSESDDSPPGNKTTPAPITRRIGVHGSLMAKDGHLKRKQVQNIPVPSIPYKKIWNTTLKHFTKEILLETLNDNKLSAKSELEVLDVLSWWLKIQNENKTPCRETTELLQCIRWSAVEPNLIEALRERTILAESREFLNKVLEYRASNNQFQGLKTLLRPSTREELFCVFIIHTDKEDPCNNKFYKANLRKSNCVKLMRTQVQVLMQPDVAACVKDNMLYVTGVGRNCEDVWKYGGSEWVQCGKMVQGRRGHCQAILNSCIYICGGNSVKNKNDVLNCIEKYDTSGQKSTKVDCQLQHAVDYSACLAYKGSVYIFGGRNNVQKNVDYVQIFNPSENTCSVVSNMPEEYQLMKAVLWENRAILLGRYDCFVYEFETKVWMKRTQLKTDVHHFGLVLENQHIYIFGGGREKSEGDWKLTNKIKYVDVNSIAKKDHELEWKEFGCLSSPCMIDICGSLRLPINQTCDSHKMQFPDLIFSESVFRHIPDDCMLNILNDDSLDVASELEVCELLLKFLRVCHRKRKRMKNPSLLTAIRWSAVDKPYAELNFVSNEIVTQVLRGSDDYITKLSRYYDFGNQYEGLKTFLRPSVKLERFMVVVGIHAGENLTSDVFRISLQRGDCTDKLSPYQSNVDASACVKDNILYVIGIGDMENQIMKYEHGVGWRECTTMIQGRSRHCVAVINSYIFICGGRSCQEHDDGVTLDHVERYNITKNKSEEPRTRLIRAVENASCVVHNNIIYIFGGGDKSNEQLSLVHAFDPNGNQSYYMKTCLPRPHSLMKSVMWGNSAILLGKETCFVYDFENETIQELKEYRTDVDYFGLVLENGILFIVGGDKSSITHTVHEANSSNAERNLTDEVRCINIHSILKKEPTSWALHDRLSMRGCVYACAAMTLPAMGGKQKRIRSAVSLHKDKPLVVVRRESQSTIDIQEDMTCSICYDIYKDPRVLPCGHSFCLECLESMDVTYNMTSCPLCGSQYGKGKKDLKQLPKNYALRNMSDKMKHTDGEQDIVTANNEPGEFGGSSQEFSISSYEMVHLSTLKSKEGKRITGVTVLGENIYLVSTMSNELEVYSVKSYQRVNTIQIARLKSPKDISSFKRFEDSLFIIDSIDQSCCVLEYRLTEQELSKLVENIQDPFTLSFTPNGEVLLVHEYKDWCWRLDLYNPRIAIVQKSVRSVILPLEIKFPKHAIQTNAGHFVICYGTGELQEDRSWSQWAISQVSDEGTILKTLPPTDGGPFYYLAVGSDDNEMFVSDGRAVQVIKLDRDLTEAKLLANDCVRASHWKPWKICSCEMSKRWLLVVGHSTGFIDIFALGKD